MLFKIDCTGRGADGKREFDATRTIRKRKPLVGRLEVALDNARRRGNIERAGEIARAFEISKLLDKKLNAAIHGGNIGEIKRLAAFLALDEGAFGRKIYLAIECRRPESIKALVECGGNLDSVPWDCAPWNLDFEGLGAGCAAVRTWANPDMFKALAEMGVKLDDALALAERIGLKRNFLVKMLDDQRTVESELGSLRINWTAQLIEKIKRMKSGAIEIDNDNVLEKDGNGAARIYYRIWHWRIAALRDLCGKGGYKTGLEE